MSSLLDRRRQLEDLKRYRQNYIHTLIDYIEATKDFSRLDEIISIHETQMKWWSSDVIAYAKDENSYIEMVEEIDLLKQKYNKKNSVITMHLLIFQSLPLISQKPIEVVNKKQEEMVEWLEGILIYLRAIRYLAGHDHLVFTDEYEKADRLVIQNEDFYFYA